MRFVKCWSVLLLAVLLLTGCRENVLPVVSEQPTPTPTATAAPTPTPTPTPSPTPAPTPTPTPTPEPTFDPLAMAESLPVEVRVGQLFLARCPDVNAVEDVQALQLGGYILFGRDFESSTPEEVRVIIEEYQAAASVPLLIAVDEEGGTVTRVSRYEQYRESPFLSPRSLYEQGGLPLLLETEQEKCRLLRSLGINVNMAPVCDVTDDPWAFMYDRSLGLSPEETGAAIAAMVQTMAEEQVGSVLKHFPGYGNNTDTHTGIAVDDRPLEQLEAVDLVPFAMGMEAGAGAVLVSHTFVNALDTELPASLSPAVNRYLREEMGFAGVVVTDDLVMQAITDLYGAEEAAVLAVLAGNDLLCSSDYVVQYNAVLQAVQEGRIPEEQLNAAAARVLQWKYDLGLLETDQLP